MTVWRQPTTAYLREVQASLPIGGMSPPKESAVRKSRLVSRCLVLRSCCIILCCLLAGSAACSALLSFVTTIESWEWRRVRATNKSKRNFIGWPSSTTLTAESTRIKRSSRSSSKHTSTFPILRTPGLRAAVAPAPVRSSSNSQPPTKSKRHIGRKLASSAFGVRPTNTSTGQGDPGSRKKRATAGTTPSWRR